MIQGGKVEGIMKIKKVMRFLSVVLAAVMVFITFVPQNVFATSQTNLSYPAQTVKITAYGGTRALNITGYANDSKLNTYHINGSQNENWRIDYVSDGVYKIVNVAADKLISLENNSAVANTYCVLKNDNGNDSQKWKIEGVEKDFLGNYLYYKITNYANPNLAISWNTETHEITVKSYTGANNQKWKLNCDGLAGFAANCVVDEGEKAGTIGGLLGKTVYVSTFADLKAQLLKTEPLTIVITKDISGFVKEGYDLRVEDNKTIIGSYSANTLYDPKFRTDDYFQKEKPSDNIIFKNLHVSVGEVEDMMAIAVYGSKNIWIDHCTFESSLPIYYDEVGKYIWVNTSSYAKENPDFVSISYNVFNRKFWGLAFGADTTGENRASVMYNKFVSIVNRAPQLGNGTLHVYNNYYVRNETSIYNDGVASIKCGSGAVVYSDAQRFEKYRKESSGYWDNEVTVDSNASFKDVGSYTDKGETPVSAPYAYEAPSCTVTTWNPSSNYDYKIISAYGSNDIKEFCNNYSGAVTSFDNLKYINHSECNRYVSKSVSSPFTFNYTDKSDNGEDTSSGGGSSNGITDGGIYMIKNVNSGKYLDVAGGVAANGTNVQQWSGSNPGAYYNTWKLVSVGDGYYKIYSQVGDGNTYLLDLTDGLTGSGTNIRIWQNTYCDAQTFKLQKNDDGTYAILTKATGCKLGLDVDSGSSSNGANVQQWGYSGGNHQKWILEKVN